MRADWPTAAAACFSGIERGRSESARRAMPDTIAPEETSTPSRPGRLREVDLVDDHHLLARGQLRRVRGELRVDDVEVVEGVPPRGRIEIQHVQQHARALGVAEELVAEPLALRRPRDEAGQVG